MKQYIILGALVLSGTAFAQAVSDAKVVSGDVDTTKFCVSASKLYSKGDIIKKHGKTLVCTFEDTMTLVENGKRVKRKLIWEVKR